jgi:hypothetical protein
MNTFNTGSTTASTRQGLCDATVIFMNQETIDRYLEALKERLLNESNWGPIVLTRTWAQSVDDEAGVYALKRGEQLIYVGETGNLQGRMLDLLDSRQHSVRRTLGARLYGDQEGFVKATASSKFPPQFEQLLNEYITSNLMVAYVVVPIGRKELEELVDKNMGNSEHRLNKRSKRKGFGKA